MTTLLMAALLAGGADPALPSGPAPTLMVLQAKDKALVSGRTVTVTRTVIKDGKPMTVQEEQKQESTYPLEGATFQTADGKKLGAEAALKKLARPTLVVVSGDGRPVDEGFLAALKPDTLVVTVTLSTVPRPLIRPILRPAPAPAKD